MNVRKASTISDLTIKPVPSSFRNVHIGSKLVSWKSLSAEVEVRRGRRRGGAEPEVVGEWEHALLRDKRIALGQCRGRTSKREEEERSREEEEGEGHGASRCTDSALNAAQGNKKWQRGGRWDLSRSPFSSSHINSRIIDRHYLVTFIIFCQEYEIRLNILESAFPTFAI